MLIKTAQFERPGPEPETRVLPSTVASRQDVYRTFVTQVRDRVVADLRSQGDLNDPEAIRRRIADAYGDLIRETGLVLGRAEREQLLRTRRPQRFLAMRFAAKEACAKALGTGIRRGVFFRDMGVVNLPSGAPTMALSGGALARLEALTPVGHKAQIHVTLTDDHPWAQAFVLITASRP